MLKLTGKEIKETELKILVFFDEFCRKKSVKYSLTGGTLIGAVRHNGFIPWDDDIDVMLKRDYYELFIKEFPEFSKGSNYELITFKNNKEYNYLFSKIVDKRTCLIEAHNKPVKELGVFIDVFPIDYIDNDYKKSYKKLKNVEFKKYLIVASNWKHFYVNNNHGFFRQILRFFFYLISRFINPKKRLSFIEKSFSKNEKRNYVACICGSYSIDKELMKAEIFGDYIDLEFEGKRFMSIIGFDSYLKSLYGDYMKLPPVEKRVARHTFDAYWKDGFNND